jgi:hypothetical protein
MSYSKNTSNTTASTQKLSEKTLHGYQLFSVKVKEKFALEDAMKAQMESRGIALLFL